MSVKTTSSPPPTRAIIPDTRPLGTFENQDVAVTVRRGISKRSHEKIGDCEQSTDLTTIGILLQVKSFEETLVLLQSIANLVGYCQAQQNQLSIKKQPWQTSL